MDEIECLVGRKIIAHDIEHSEILKDDFPYIILDDGRRIYLSESQ